MSEPIIAVEHLSKSFPVGHEAPRPSYRTLRETLIRTGGNFARKTVDMLRGLPIVQGDSVEKFWALRDVSFEVKRGEAVGIIGRNGAGKSTLLRILSRISEPTKGRATLRGRVASLLEVGTGFHPELTGRENVLLNGTILGMRRREIRARFDEIVAFAEVEKFLDTPVKHYSSGMYLRLAFAVAAHLEPEILVVDEVLAVGDIKFQEKCLGKMQNVAADGRTILFVSHSMEAVLRLCSAGLLLHEGKLEHHGPVREAVDRYVSSLGVASEVRCEPISDRPSITMVRIDQQALAMGDVVIEIGFRSPFPLTPPVPGLVISASTGAPVLGSNPRFHSDGFNGVSASEGTLRFVARGVPLLPGSYRASVWLGDWHVDYDHKPDIVAFDFGAVTQGVPRPGPEIIGSLDWPGTWKLT